MASEWRNNEPEVGQRAYVRIGNNGDQPTIESICIFDDNDGKVWKSFWSGQIFSIGSKWQPITTPEEDRLRAEVERLRGIERKLIWFEKVNLENPGKFPGVVREILGELRKAGGVGDES